MSLKDIVLGILREKGPLGLENLIEQVRLIDPDERAVNVKIAAVNLNDDGLTEFDEIWRFCPVPYDVYMGRIREEERREIDESGVSRLATAMKAKLRDARLKGRGGWDSRIECSNEDLSRMLREHVDKGDPVDVANFCMFLFCRGEGIL